MKKNINSKAWIVSADMGYGHQRAVFPLKEIANENIITVGQSEAASKYEKKLWSRITGVYELISRAKKLPVVGSILFNLLDTFLKIPTFYPIRNLSSATFQVNLLESSINKGLCSGMLEKIKSGDLPLITSFYAPAIASDMKSLVKTFCIICDADLNRVWVAKEPWESRIEYFAPCGKAAQRLKSYGVQQDKIHLTGFPLPKELTGDVNLNELKKNLGQRLILLDPQRKFWNRNEKNVHYFLGDENCVIQNKRKLTITYSVGGAGAQKEIGKNIIKSLKNKILNNEIKVNLAAGIKREVFEYFKKEAFKIIGNNVNVKIIYSENLSEYFSLFNKSLTDTDILWTKPSELSFYSALGFPIIMAPAIGAQERFNMKWLFEIQAGIKQENPDYTNEWIFDMLNKGRLAEAAWSGFLKARKLGTYKILELLEKGQITKNDSPVFR